MDLPWDKVLGVIASLIALATAYLTFQSKRAETRPGNPPAIRVLSFQQEATNWHLILVRTVGVVLIVLGIAEFALSWFLDEPMLIFPGAVSVACGCFVLYRMRGDVSKKSSRTRRQTTVRVQAAAEPTMTASIEALKRMGVDIVSQDYDTATIEGVLFSWVWGHSKMTVKVSSLDQLSSSVEVSSDARLSTVLIDFGMNERNIRRFVRQLDV
jgi:hypothetical protein